MHSKIVGQSRGPRFKKYSLSSELPQKCANRIYVSSEGQLIKEIRVKNMGKKYIPLLLKDLNTFTIIKNQNIVQIHDYFLEGQFLYIVMEYCQSDLSEHIRNLNFNERAAIRILHQILEGCLQLSNLNIVHGNLSSRTILANKEGVVKIAGLQSSKRYHKCGDLGAPDSIAYYRAPEAYREGLNKKSDIWSLGVILYEMVCKQAPWGVRSAQQFLEKAKSHQISFKNANISEQVKALVQEMLKFHSVNRIEWKQLVRKVEAMMKGYMKQEQKQGEREQKQLIDFESIAGKRYIAGRDEKEQKWVPPSAKLVQSIIYNPHQAGQGFENRQELHMHADEEHQNQMNRPRSPFTLNQNGRSTPKYNPNTNNQNLQWQPAPRIQIQNVYNGSPHTYMVPPPEPQMQGPQSSPLFPQKYKRKGSNAVIPPRQDSPRRPQRRDDNVQRFGQCYHNAGPKLHKGHGLQHQPQDPYQPEYQQGYQYKNEQQYRPECEYAPEYRYQPQCYNQLQYQDEAAHELQLQRESQQQQYQHQYHPKEQHQYQQKGYLPRQGLYQYEYQAQHLPNQHHNQKTPLANHEPIHNTHRHQHHIIPMPAPQLNMPVHLYKPAHPFRPKNPVRANPNTPIRTPINLSPRKRAHTQNKRSNDHSHEQQPAIQHAFLMRQFEMALRALCWPQTVQQIMSKEYGQMDWVQAYWFRYALNQFRDAEGTYIQAVFKAL